MKQSILEISNITFKLPDISRAILQNINLKVTAGEFIVILGSNGSGKSSLLKLLCREYQPTSGLILLINKHLEKITQKELAQNVVTLTQNCSESLFCSLTIFENYLLAKTRLSGVDRIQIKMSKKLEREFCQNYLRSFNPNLADKLNVTVQNLSGGEKQALALAFGVLHPPKILLLDEHTSALDPQTANKIMQLTKDVIIKNHITCLLTTHSLEIALNYGNKILALQNGKILREIDKEQSQKIIDREALLQLCY